VIGREPLLSMAAAARLLNDLLADAKISPVTVWRWATKGVRAQDGSRVFLEHRRIGSRRLVTSAEAIDRFARALAAARPDQKNIVPSTPPTSTTWEAAKADLKANGF
jgi:hypothetical protein